MSEVKTADAQSKLRDLELCMPNRDPYVYRFGALLADRLEDFDEEIAPTGFAMTALCLISDLEEGVGGQVGRPDYGKVIDEPTLVGLQEVMYTIVLRSLVMGIADEIFPEVFARKVREEME